MALEIKLNQKLTQTLVMTPQLQQAIKLLQLGREEYLQVLEKELLENPVLEEASEAPGGSSSRDNSGSVFSENNVAASPAETASNEDSSDATPDGFLIGDGNAAVSSQEFDWDRYLQSDLESLHSGPRKTARYNDDEDHPALEASVCRPEGLAQHILWQLRTSELRAEDHEIAVQIVGNLDRNGYLQCTVEEICAETTRTVEDVERVLNFIQHLDPAGIAARDLRECLLIQLDLLGLADSLAWRLVDKHLQHLEARKYETIAREEHVSIQQVLAALETVKTLEPRPGRPFIDEMPVYITPDIYVRKVGEEYVISLNEAGIPRLRVNPDYRRFISGSEQQNLENKDYIQDRIRSAAWLIKSIHQRQQTIYRVTESIIKFQRDFLEKGVQGLRPLVLRDVAQDVSMHESTVSRVTTNKYVHTPQGVFELKFFFTSGLKSGDGVVSSESVKERIRAMILQEDTRKPLSDQAIVATLKAEGVDIARRTVAKYREMMNILSSSQRKKVY